MNLDDIINQLLQISNSGDTTSVNVATFIGQAVQAARNGQLTKEELAEIVKDVQRQISISQEMSDMAYKETLNTLINGLITVIGAV